MYRQQALYYEESAHATKQEAQQVLGDAYEWYRRQAYRVSEYTADTNQRELATVRVEERRQPVTISRKWLRVSISTTKSIINN